MNQPDKTNNFFFSESFGDWECLTWRRLSLQGQSDFGIGCLLRNAINTAPLPPFPHKVINGGGGGATDKQEKGMARGSLSLNEGSVYQKK